MNIATLMAMHSAIRTSHQQLQKNMQQPPKKKKKKSKKKGK